MGSKLHLKLAFCGHPPVQRRKCTVCSYVTLLATLKQIYENEFEWHRTRKVAHAWITSDYT